MSTHKGQKEIIRKEIKKELARRSYADYCIYSHEGRWILGKHLDYICTKVEDLVYRRIRQNILIISMPPQHGKSQAVTETLPSWYLGKWPHKRVIEVSYGDDLARRFGRRNKQKITQFGKELFDIELAPNSRSDTEFEIADHSGSMISRGIMAGITGQPGDCFPKGTMIMTECGEIEISQLVTMKNPPLVLSYNHSCDIIELKKIVARREKIANEFTTIETVSGNKIKSTREHRYYEKERGYTKATILNRGNTLLSIRNRHMPTVQPEETERKQNMSCVFREVKKVSRNTGMQLLWEAIRKFKIRIREKAKKRSARFLLFNRMRSQAFKGEDVCEVSCMQWNNSNQREQILFKGVQGNTKSTQVRKNKLSYLWETISAFIKEKSVLLKSVCRQGTFGENERSKQFPLQRWFKLFKMVFRDETFNNRERQSSMCMLRSARSNHGQNEFEGASYRRESSKQCTGEFNNDVRRMPYEASQISTDTVSGIINTSEEGIAVYDIQVEGNHNFFANGILVHNCIIIDDPIKNKQEAESETYRDRIWEEFLNSILTRLSADGIIILIMTRWHEDDLAGRILANMPDKAMEINIPLEAEDSDILGRAVGEPLFPEIGKDKGWLEDFKQNYQTQEGTRAWLSLMQGRPTAQEGNLIKRDWWRYYEQLPPITYKIISVDATFKNLEDNDFVVIQAWGKAGPNYYLVDQVRARMSFTETLKALRAFNSKHKSRIAIYIEDKANGSAIIDVLSQKISGIIAYQPRDSKVVRAQSVIPLIEAGNVYLPKYAAFTNDFVEECASFPNGANDDQVDGLSMGLTMLKQFIDIPQTPQQDNQSSFTNEPERSDLALW